MKTMSDNATREQPSPTAGPFTAAIIGSRHRTIPVTIWRPCTSVRLRNVRVARQLVDVFEVTAGRERAAGAREHGHPRLVVRVQLREQRGQARVEDVVGGIELVGPVQRDDADRAVGLDLDLVGKVVCAHVVGNSRIRLAIRLRWICDVPPITLWARL